MTNSNKNAKNLSESAFEAISSQPECAKKFFDKNLPPGCAENLDLFREYLESLSEGDLRPILFDD